MEREKQLAIWLPFHLARFSAKQIKQAIELFGSLESALQQPRQAWQDSKILTAKKLAHFLEDDFEQKIAETIAWQNQPNQQILLLQDNDYPKLLSEITDPPILLYVMGEVSILSDPQLGIVGSRNASKYGENIAQDFAQHLTRTGLTITSGLASGIDKSAHLGALKALKTLKSPGVGCTVAVVGTGLDRVYPAANRDLAHQISEKGAIVSEYPLGTKPLPRYFPERNRIISGLSVGVLVVEAALKSGSLITARLAMEQGREVFAVPGSINSTQAKGCHQLIRQGAKLVESGQDILEDLRSLLQLSLFEENDVNKTIADKTINNPKQVKGSTEGILQWVEFEPIGLDELVVLSKMAVSDIQSQMMMLELSGEVEAMSASRWRRLKGDT